jgi:hypothetical protein
VNFAISYKSAIGSTPLISDVKHSVAIVQRISWICSTIIIHSSLLDLAAYIYLHQQGIFYWPWARLTSTHFRIEKVNAVAENKKGIWKDPAIPSTVLTAVVVYWIAFSSCVGTFIVGDHGMQNQNSVTHIYPTDAVVQQQVKITINRYAKLCCIACQTAGTCSQELDALQN